MPAYWWIAHVLAMHLSVPEPVTLKFEDLQPGRCAQMRMIGEVGKPKGWSIEYDIGCWNREPKRRAWVLAHELCHGAFDYTKDVSQLSVEETLAQESRADSCADAIVREHGREPRR